MGDLMETRTATSREGLVRLTHIIYALHAFSAVMGVILSAVFFTGWPSILAVFLNYARRSDVRGTYLESHFRWQIRTFWFAVFWVLSAVFLFVTIGDVPLADLIEITVAVTRGPITVVWVLYRIVRGWLALNDGRGIVA